MHIMSKERFFSVKNSIEKLLYILEDNFSKKAFKFNDNQNTKDNKNDLINLLKRADVYSKRDHSKLYIIFAGTFSSGKSSTINSILKLWETDDERETDIQTTDTAISIIINKEGEKNAYKDLFVSNTESLIKISILKNDFLDNITILDTPGAGEKISYEDLVKNFLPTCDLVVYLFNAIQAYNRVDKEMLKALTDAISDIPLVFVITRADMIFKKSKFNDMSYVNFDHELFKKTTDKIKRRMFEDGLNSASIENAEFMAISNGIEEEPFGIEELKNKILTFPNDSEIGKELKNKQKVGYFEKKFDEHREYFYRYIKQRRSLFRDFVIKMNANIRIYDTTLSELASGLPIFWDETKNKISSLSIVEDDLLYELDFFKKSVSQNDIEKQKCFPKYNLRTIDSIKQDIEKLTLDLKENLVNSIKASAINKLDEYIDEKNTPKKYSIEEINAIIIETFGNIEKENYGRLNIDYFTKLTNEINDIYRETVEKSSEGLVDIIKNLDDNLSRLITEKKWEQYESITNSVTNTIKVRLSKIINNAIVFTDGMMVTDSMKLFENLGVAEEIESVRKSWSSEEQDQLLNNETRKMFPYSSENLENYNEYVLEYHQRIIKIKSSLTSLKENTLSDDTSLLIKKSNERITDYQYQLNNIVGEKIAGFVKNTEKSIINSINSSFVKDKEKTKSLIWKTIKKINAFNSVAFMLLAISLFIFPEKTNWLLASININSLKNILFISTDSNIITIILLGILTNTLYSLISYLVLSFNRRNGSLSIITEIKKAKDILNEESYKTLNAKFELDSITNEIIEIYKSTIAKDSPYQSFNSKVIEFCKTYSSETHNLNERGNILKSYHLNFFTNKEKLDIEIKEFADLIRDEAIAPQKEKIMNISVQLEELENKLSESSFEQKKYMYA